LRWRDDIGRRSIETLYLNDTDRVVGVRVKIGETIAKALEAIRASLEEYVAGKHTTRKRNTVTRGLEELLRQANPEAEFSALAATVVLSDPNYIWIKQNLVHLNLWTELAPLEAAAVGIALHP
jgi:hypothetical protein